ncbi:MAG TPA: hypothetical protein VKG01_08585 [Thermoanaerobaculia bacterium]|nr:hypothetical protein [Thermoanaerobaculia bacterium]
MSAESSAFDSDYIRRAERFKALSTFEQFLSGIRRGFLPTQGGLDSDLAQLHNEVKRAPSLSREALAALDAKLDAAAARLRAADIPMSPSLTRLYFEKVRPTDGRIPFYLLRFYLWQPEADDENLLDKVDYLATVVAAGTPDPSSAGTRSREEARRIFDRLLADSSWPQIDGEAAPQLARAFDEVAAQIATAREFEELAGEGRIESLRNLKRQLSRGVRHPEILTAAAMCNLTARAVFRRLYEKEERGLRELARRIDDLERRLPRREADEAVLLQRFRESRNELERQALEGTVRWRQLVEVQRAAADALKLLTGAEPEGAPAAAMADLGEVPLDETRDAFWGPCLKRILSAVESGDPVKSVQGWRALEECRLDDWETEAARRAIARKTLTRPERIVLFAAALRVKAEAEMDAARKSPVGGVPPDLMREARATLSHASELDRTFAGFAVIQGDDASEEVRRWTRTRLRLLHATSGLWLALDSR